MSQITEELSQYIASQGYLFAAEVRNNALANDGTLFLQIEAGTKPLAFIFNADVEALAYVDTFIGTTLTTPTTITPFNYKPSSAVTTTAIIRTATAATTLGTARGTRQTGSGNPGQGVGGSSAGRPSILAPGEKITLRITNKGGSAKCVSEGVYFTELL